MASIQRQRSSSRTRHGSTTVPPNPTTPLRPSSRSSLRNSQHGGSTTSPTPYGSSTTSAPAISLLEPQFAELADSMADLEANFMHLQLLHESLGRFGECFAAFLYGLEVRAFCVDFPEAPIKESMKRAKYLDRQSNELAASLDAAAGRTDDMILGNETTFMTTDTSFVENPAPSTLSSKGPTPKYMGDPTPVTPAPRRARGGSTIGGRGAGRGGASTRGGAAAGRGGSGIPTRGGSGIGRPSGLPRGRGTGRGTIR